MIEVAVGDKSEALTFSVRENSSRSGARRSFRFGGPFRPHGSVSERGNERMRDALYWWLQTIINGGEGQDGGVFNITAFHTNVRLYMLNITIF